MLTASVNTTVTPATLTVTSDRRHVSVEVHCAGETATATGSFPVQIVDSDRTWEQVSDDGTTAVYVVA